MTEFINGATSMACLTVSMFFFRFWKQSLDRLFLIFGIAFFVFALNRVLLLVLESRGEGTGVVYLTRLLVFILIIVAVIDRNVRRDS